MFAVQPTVGGTASRPPESGGGARRSLTFLLFLAAVAFPCAVLYRAAAPIAALPSFARWDSGSTPVVISAVESDNEDARLEKVLKEAAMEDKTVILTTLNAAWASPGSIIDLFIESFRFGDGTCKLLNHLVIITLDRKAYVRCMSIHFHCFALTTTGVDFSREKHFMSAGYLKMMWRRIEFLRVVLEKGYNFIFSDADIMWFRDPLPHFYPDGDFQIACDQYLGSATDLGNRPNGGFNYVKSNNRSIEFYKFWYSSREKHPGLHDQDVLNFIKYDPLLAEIGVRIRFLSTTYFGGICEPSRDFSKVCTMHANCCIGLGRKIHDLRVMLDDWRNYMALPPNIKRSGLYSWRVPQNCSLAELQS
ncbi:uncharacterized protein At4g15970-like isoform X2 [Phoenix dactylifera]|uniref:Glycosyltransferase n=1 Tax=Phoenix dactylifera TaxID=42345 RepID=A0A8B8ZE88_PHODC|nr:uncharacterized protein At4g15970-like isoform X2 [Phoenix dactylifera]